MIGAEGGSRTRTPIRTTDFKSGRRASYLIFTKRDEPIFTVLAAVKVMLHPVTSRDKTSSSLASFDPVSFLFRPKRAESEGVLRFQMRW